MLFFGKTEAKQQLCFLTQEALANVISHAAASTISVGTRVENDEYELYIEDDGRGIAPDILLNKEKQGAGLSGMRERARLLDGELRIDTPHKGGTRIHILFPKPKTQKEHAR